RAHPSALRCRRARVSDWRESFAHRHPSGRVGDPAEFLQPGKDLQQAEHQVTVKVKICGVTRQEDAELAIGLGADMIGLNFYPLSPRSLTLEQVRAIRLVISNRCEVVGVFVNAARSYVEHQVRELRLDYLQFHGDEGDDALLGWPLKVIRALRLEGVV